MFTLHAYILRELLKTFGLTILALTGVFTLGGGLYNVMRFEGVSSADLIRFFPILLPIAITLTMPIAALFSVTMTYGRLAADNEFVACRAAGINIDRMFLAALLLGVFVGAFALLFGNYVIPTFMQRLVAYGRANLRDIAQQQLLSRGRLRYQNQFFMTAEGVNTPSAAALREKNMPIDGQDYLLVEKPTFLQLDQDGRLVRFSSALWGLCQFDTTRSPVEVTIYTHQARDYEIGRSVVHIDRQQIGPIEFPVAFPERLSWMDLNTLLHFRIAPWDAPPLRDRLREFVGVVATAAFHADVARRVAAGEQLTLTDPDGRQQVVSAETAERTPKGVSFGKLRVETTRAGEPRPTQYRAARGQLSGRPLPDGRMIVEVRLIQTPAQPVLETNPRAGAGRKPLEKPSLNLDPIELPASAAELTPAHVLDASAPLPVQLPEFDDTRAALAREARETQRKVASQIHFRLGAATAVPAAVLMAAILGLIFRGGRALGAFLLACVPFGCVVILMAMGSQLTKGEFTQNLGLLVIWGGVAGMYAGTLLLAQLGVRR